MSSAAQRNRDPILGVLRSLLAEAQLVLEVASGAGEHAVHCARHLPALRWQPSDPSPEARALIRDLTEAAGLANVLPPIDLDAAAETWPIERADALVCINMQSHGCEDEKSIGYAACICINMVHISEWAATIGLFRGCARVLQPGAPLILYGPYLWIGVQKGPRYGGDRRLKGTPISIV